MKKRAVINKYQGRAESIINYFRSDQHIYIKKHNHPLWKSYQTFPPVPYTLRRFAKLCHFLNYVPRDNAKPFIADYEHVLMMSGNSRDYVHMVNSSIKIESQLKDEKCRAIIVPSRGAIRETTRYIDSSEIMDKMHIVRPVYPPQRENLHNHSGPFTILTIGNKFWGKGIPIAIEAFRILRERHGNEVKMQLVCGDIPPGYPLPEGLNLINTPMLTDKLRVQLYSEAHVFIFPCLHDSYAVFQESMAFGVPIIATRIYDKDEIVFDGRTGYLLDTPISMYDGSFGVDWKTWGHFQEIVKTMYDQGKFTEIIDEIVMKAELFFNDIALVRKMGLAAQKIQRENFAPDSRNMQVRQIYDQIFQSI